MFAPGKQFQPSLVYLNSLTMEYLKGVSLGYVLALLGNIRLGWKGLPETNPVAYYEHTLIADVKCFIALTSGMAPALSPKKHIPNVTNS